MRQQIEFKPPSDFTGDGDAGGGKKKIWMWLGIGCGVVALIIGLLLVLGTWKTVSCCVEAGKQTHAAQQFAVEFATELQRGDAKAAWSKTTSDFQSRMTLTEFRDAIAAHRDTLDQAGEPRLKNIHVRAQNADDIEEAGWDVTVQYAAPSATEVLVLNLRVVARGDGEEARFLVDRAEFDVRQRRLDSEPPARAALDFLATLQAGDYENAHRQLAPGFRAELDLPAFRELVEARTEVLLAPDLEVRAVDYSGNTSATVTLATPAGAGAERVVTMALINPSPPLPRWQVAGLDTLVREAAQEQTTGDEAAPGAKAPADDAAGVDGGPPAAGADQPAGGVPAE